MGTISSISGIVTVIWLNVVSVIIPYVELPGVHKADNAKIVRAIKILGTKIKELKDTLDKANIPELVKRQKGIIYVISKLDKSYADLIMLSQSNIMPTIPQSIENEDGVLDFLGF